MPSFSVLPGLKVFAFWEANGKLIHFPFITFTPALVSQSLTRPADFSPDRN